MASTHWHQALNAAKFEPSEDRRRYFRVDDHIALKFRTISEHEHAGLEKHILNTHPDRRSLTGSFAATTQQMEHLIRGFKNREPELTKYLELLNEKVDMLARSLFLEDNELLHEKKQAVNLSASGLSFLGDCRLETNSLLEMQVLTFPTLLHIHASARVIRCAALNDGSGSYDVAVDFEVLREDDRELLIQHVVQLEANHLRARQDDD